MNEVAIIFGRFNPPHKGHKAAWELASQSPIWYIGTNQNTVGEDDPLPFDIKTKAMSAIWPEAGAHTVAESTWLSMAHNVFEKYGDVVLKVVTEEEWPLTMIMRYNGISGKHGSYKFSKVEQVKPPRLSSATDLRNAVKSGDRAAFANAAGVPSDFEVAGVPYFDLVAKYLLPYNSEETVTEDNLNVMFHDKLNPALFDENGKMLSNVRHKLLEIAEDFKESLGVTIDGLKDITISGSNAAYNYTPTSDVDLHLIVDLPRVDHDELYRELFDAKKFQYNASHEYKIKGYDVELYVQNANDPHYSLGIYSLMDDDWVHKPHISQTGYDPETTMLKYDKLKHLILMAIRKRDADLAGRLRQIIKKYRAAGLKASGEFGPENLAFKGLRSNGYIEELYKLINELKDKFLSLEEAAPVDVMLHTYEKWPGGANKWIANKVSKLDRLVADLRKNAYAPGMKIFGEASVDDDQIPDSINVFIDTKNIQLDKEVGKEALLDLVKISERFYNMFNPYIMLNGKVFMLNPRATKWVQAPQMAARQMSAAGRTGVPITMFNRSFTSIAYAGMAESLEEANMSPTALVNYAMSPITQKMRFGFEAELIVPGVAEHDEGSYERPGDDEDDWADPEPTDFQKTAQVVADNLSKALTIPVTVSNVHGAKKNGTLWYLEPDSSIDDGRAGGLEFVSPPMPFNDGMQKLDQFFSWAKQYGCTTNESTGFHVGISVPEAEVDKLKLVLFMGDSHVLQLFNRQSNIFTKSSLGKAQKLLTDPVRFAQAMTLIKSGLDKMATSALADLLMPKDKYVSINFKPGYVEFRAAGGTYLEQELDIKDTILRYVKAYGIAIDPDAERKEYARKLFKLVGNAGENINSVQLFSMYSSGFLSKEDLVAKLKALRPAPAPVDPPVESVENEALPIVESKTLINSIAAIESEMQLAFDNLQSIVNDILS